MGCGRKGGWEGLSQRVKWSLQVAVAFLVAFQQNKQLIGEKGLLPCKLYLQDVKRYFKGKVGLDALSYAPTLLWFLDWSAVDSSLDGLALAGLALAAFVLLTGCANMVLMALLWLLYLSLVNVGQIWTFLLVAAGSQQRSGGDSRLFQVLHPELFHQYPSPGRLSLALFPFFPGLSVRPEESQWDSQGRRLSVSFWHRQDLTKANPAGASQTVQPPEPGFGIVFGFGKERGQRW
ncbi:uncharacterized protein LOC131378661 [Hirundo rustica]|uniref:uncharacterized protein LOC131378661 n=1 Tax=Hirundo rustica TaxID=43150 RepID=UPI002674085E|nr:uncharacterized protein LOC131378661 [Hirundo rustica]